MDLQKDFVPTSTHIIEDVRRRAAMIERYRDRLVDDPQLVRRWKVFDRLQPWALSLPMIGLFSLLCLIHPGFRNLLFLLAGIAGCVGGVTACIIVGKRGRAIWQEIARSRRHAFRTLAFLDERAADISALGMRQNRLNDARHNLYESRMLLAGATAEQALRLINEKQAQLRRDVTELLAELDEAVEADEPLMRHLDEIEKLRALRGSANAVGGEYRATQDVALHLAANELEAKLKEDADRLPVNRRLLPVP